ncbi:MAG: hypothetical protein GOV00_04580, partial [Candidatus Altiarchaeota archaeon]|nr:hypothetical protein [Candidatus Altiarchaeota archaeon]
MRKYLLSGLLFVFLMSTAFSETLVVNSMDWRSVFLGMEYAHNMNYDIRFISSPFQAETLARTLPKENVTVLEMRDPILPGYSQYLRNLHGVYSSELKFRDAADFQDYMMDTFQPKVLFFVSEAEPENAVISLPIAYKKNGFVFFQQNNLLGRLGEVNLIYLVGNIRRDFRRNVLSVSTVLDSIVEIINEESPYSNSVHFLDMWGRTDEAILTSGDILERTIFEADMPVLLVGLNDYSAGFIELLKDRTIDKVFLVGSTLLQVGQKIRDDSDKEIATLIKYGESKVTGGVSEVNALTVYELPIPEPILNFTRAIYDPSAKKLYVTILNLGDGIAKTIGIHPIISDENVVVTVRDEDVFTIWPGEEVTTSYSVDLSSYQPDSLSVILSARFGRYRDFMVKYIEDEKAVDVRRIGDRSEIEVTKATYDGTYIRIFVDNIAPVDIYVGGYVQVELDGELQDLLLPTTRI